jgi:2-oxoglutarate/2-oxoacid ferredoxin oxidoreductase subunit beta
VISPCVTFNNHPTSTKSYDYVRAHNMASENKLDYVEPKEEITVDYPVGSSTAIALHDGSRLVLHKLSAGHDPRDADAAIMTIRTNATKGEVATGLLYINEAQQDMHDILSTDARPLNALPMAELCPGSKALEGINARLR